MTRRFPGTYNARRDSLDDYWSNVYGRQSCGHGHLRFLRKCSATSVRASRTRDRREKQKNLVSNSIRSPSKDMLVACVWDRWSQARGTDLYSFAAITDEPTPEVAATGHQRTVITLQEQHLSEWLSPAAISKDRLEQILTDKEVPYYIHQIAA
jgi:hypothetical protein